MQISLSIVLSCILGPVAIAVAFRMCPIQHSHSRVAVVLAVLPALVMLALFYSLAVHMYRSLGAWPTRIGEDGFPEPLVTHAFITQSYCMIFAVVSFYVWPAIFLLCLLVQRRRAYLYYLGVYAAACFVCFGAMFLAPSQFLYWWWD